MSGHICDLIGLLEELKRLGIDATMSNVQHVPPRWGVIAGYWCRNSLSTHWTHSSLIFVRAFLGNQCILWQFTRVRQSRFKAKRTALRRHVHIRTHFSGEWTISESAMCWVSKLRILWPSCTFLTSPCVSYVTNNVSKQDRSMLVRQSMNWNAKLTLLSNTPNATTYYSVQIQ